MKKFAVVVMLLLVALCLLGCQKPQQLTLYVPDGAPALSVASVISNQKIGNNPVDVVVTTGEETVAKCTSGEADIAVLPTNAAIKICSARQDYCLFSVNVYGLLYVVGTRQVELAQLAGQTVHSIGLGNTPEYVFKTILDSRNIAYEEGGEGQDKVHLSYYTDGSTVILLVLQGKAEFALLGEPAVTNLIQKAASQNITVHRLFDLQQLWQQATGSDSAGYPQASLIVKKSLLTSSFARALQQAVEGNPQWLSANLQQLNQLMKDNGSSLDVNYTQQIIDACNLTPVMAQQAKADIEKYLQNFAGMSQLLPIDDSVYYQN